MIVSVAIIQTIQMHQVSTEYDATL